MRRTPECSTLKRGFEQDPEMNSGLIALNMSDVTLLLYVCLVTIRLLKY